MEKEIHKEGITLGILGGLGPAASAYFYELVTRHTAASADCDHVDCIMVSFASTPDRTAFITGKSDHSPVAMMADAADRLTRAGADVIAMPCNTAHYFYNELETRTGLPIINIIDGTVAFAKAGGAKKLGILATEGTVVSGSYHKYCDKYGIDCEVPSPEFQKELTDIIYNHIKPAKAFDISRFYAVCDNLVSRGCDRLILGCTELSLINLTYAPERFAFLDSLTVLAYLSIKVCGKLTTGFPPDFDKCFSLLPENYLPCF